MLEGLLDWYQKNKRDLPWRRDQDPYRIWVSEVMLQQTRVEAVIPYYQRFLAALPDVQALAQVPEQALLKLWEGLGYYSRARNLKAAALRVVELGGFPHSARELRALPGFGPYTAGAVASICFGERVAAVDGNVLRVYARQVRQEESVQQPSIRRAAEAWVLEAMPQDAGPGCFNQALMELGAVVCTPKAARCGDCPVREHCKAGRAGEALAYPRRAPKAEKRLEVFEVYLARQGGRALVRQRPAKGLLAGLWEFPHHVSGFTPIQVALNHRHVFTHLIWEMQGVDAHCLAVPEGGTWVDAAQLQALPLSSAMEPFRAWTLRKLLEQS